MTLGDRAHDVEAQAGALDLRSLRLETIKAIEDAAKLRLRNADAGILDPHPRGVGRGAGDLDGDLRHAVGVFHGVVEQVGDRGAQVVDVAADDQRRLEIDAGRDDRVFTQVVARPRRVDALLDQPAEIDRRALFELAPLPRHAGAQHLLDGVLQAIGILQHDPVKLLALRVADLARLQRLEVEANRGDRRFQLVGDRVEEAVLLFGDAHFTEQEHRVDDEAGDDQGEGRDAKNERRHAPAVDENPPDVQGDGGGDEDDAEDDEDD